jgi:hypothetical protein
VAEHDFGRFDEVMDWPLRELLLAFVARLRSRARETYALELLVWAALAPHQKKAQKPPSIPSILR